MANSADIRYITTNYLTNKTIDLLIEDFSYRCETVFLIF